MFAGRCATQADVEGDRAVFALGDTVDAEPFTEPLPQPVLWYDEETPLAALIVQAESHETADGDQLEVLGLLLPDGRTVVAFTDDVEEVDGDDPDWLERVDQQRGGELDGVDRPDDDELA